MPKLQGRDRLSLMTCHLIAIFTSKISRLRYACLAVFYPVTNSLETKPLLSVAEDLGNRLLPIFNSPTGLPYVYVNLRTGHTRDAVTNPAETGTLLLEFGTLSKLTGRSVFYEKAKHALVETFKRRSPLGLVGESINVETGAWTSTDSHISGGIDS